MQEIIGLIRRREIAGRVRNSRCTLESLGCRILLTTYWFGGTGNWYNSANWNAGVPTASIDAGFNVAGNSTTMIAGSGSVHDVEIKNQNHVTIDTFASTLTVAGSLKMDENPPPPHSRLLIHKNQISYQ